MGNILICQPATLMLLVSRITCRTFAVTIIITCTHQIVSAHSEPSRITSIIQVRESHAMGELMAKSSDTIEFATPIQLSTAGISIHSDATKGKRLTIIGIRKSKLVWPYRRSSTTISLTLSCIKHKHLVYFPIAIPVVLREIDALSGCPLTSLSYHLAGAKVVASRSISSIIGTWVLQLTDAYYIKVEFELSCALCLEVIFHTAFESIVGIVLSIGYLVVQSTVVTTLKLGVGKLCQDDQSLLRALENISNICLSPHCATVVGLGSPCHSLATRIRELAIRINLISC